MEDGGLEYILEFMMEVKDSTEARVKFQDTNLKFQISSNDQGSNTNQLSEVNSRFGIWYIGSWDLCIINKMSLQFFEK